VADTNRTIELGSCRKTHRKAGSASRRLRTGSLRRGEQEEGLEPMSTVGAAKPANRLFGPVDSWAGPGRKP
jgi:hypothetical protein